MQNIQSSPWPRQERNLLLNKMLQDIAPPFCPAWVDRLLRLPRLIRLGTVFAYTVALTWCLLTSSSHMSHVPRLLPQQDKVEHFGAFGLYAVLLLWAGIPQIRRPNTRLVAVCLYCILYGITAEILQQWLQPGDRFFSWGDILADSVGACLASAIWPHFATRMRIET